MMPKIIIASYLRFAIAKNRGLAVTNFWITGKNNIRAMSSFLFINDEIFP